MRQYQVKDACSSFRSYQILLASLRYLSSNGSGSEEESMSPELINGNKKHQGVPTLVHVSNVSASRHCHQ